MPEKGEIIELSDGTKYKVTKAGKKNGTVEYYRPASTKKLALQFLQRLLMKGSNITLQAFLPMHLKTMQN